MLLKGVHDNVPITLLQSDDYINDHNTDETDENKQEPQNQNDNTNTVPVPVPVPVPVADINITHTKTTNKVNKTPFEKNTPPIKILPQQTK
eukprot:UN07744